MRIIIAKDLNIEKYDWGQYPFAKNIIDTIKKFKISQNVNKNKINGVINGTVVLI